MLATIPDLAPEQVESSLENYIFPILFPKMIAEFNLKERDDFVLVCARSLVPE